MAQERPAFPRNATWTAGRPDDDGPYALFGDKNKNTSTAAAFPRMTSWNGKSTGSGYVRHSSFTSTISSMLPPMTTNKSLWKQPELHHEISRSSVGSNILPNLLEDVENSKAKAHRTENWHELFYDLIFVAAAIQIGTILKAEISARNVIQSSLLFMILRSTWDNLMMYQNRFDTSDLLHYLFYLIHAMAAFVMTLHLSIGEEDHNWNAAENISAFSTAAAIARFTMVIMYLHVFYYTESYRTGFRNYLRLLTLSQFMSGCIFIIVAGLNTYVGYRMLYEVAWMLTFFIERTFVSVATTILQRRLNKSGRMSQHFEHMVHRQSVFILSISGEAIIQLVQGLSTYSAMDYLRGCLGFAIVYGVGICYYEQQQVCLAHPSVVKDTIIGYLWETMHIALSLSILFFAVGVKVVYSRSSEDRGHDRSLKEELLMTISASVSLILIISLRIMHKGIYIGSVYYRVLGTMTRSLAYSFRYVLAMVIALIPFATRSATASIIVLSAFVLILVFIDTVALSKRADPSRAEEMGFIVSHHRGGRSVSRAQNQETENIGSSDHDHGNGHSRSNSDDRSSFAGFDFDPDRIVSTHRDVEDRQSNAHLDISICEPLIEAED
jgi:low temperature requirement protein LtrA